METLSTQFNQALSFIGLSQKQTERAQEAHKEIRNTLETSPDLRELGIDTILIGSYRRGTAIHPGKDVDVFSKLTKASKNDDPATLFETIASVLKDEYGDRANPQARSVKVDFPNEFAVDVVPAVPSGGQWAIPTRDRDAWGDPDSRWVETNPERLTELSSERNSAPTVGGQGAYIPTVKLMRQARRHHLGDSKPGGFYIELLTYWTFERGVSGNSFAELFAAALRGASDQLQSGQDLIDPAMGAPYEPKPSGEERQHAAEVFAELATKAERALTLKRCPAAVLWREILGTNERGDCFPLPPNCDEDGNEITEKTRVAAMGSKEASGFA